MPTVRLGNHAARTATGVVEDRQVSTIYVADDETHQERIRTITHADGFWPAMSAHDKPAWVTCDDTELEQALAEYYNCPVGEPESPAE